MRLIMETIGRFLRAPRQSFFLWGPRGTGKSTWTRSVFPEALRIDLLSPDLFRSYSARPERLRELIEGNPGRRQVVIDEIQRVPDLLGVVHALIEERRPLQFILTGSSARKLKRTGVNLLAGRALIRSLHPFMASELGARFDFPRALRVGLLPLVWFADAPDDVLKAYAALYLHEEVQAEGLVRNIGAFARFLEALSFSHAAPLNISKVAQECAVERKVVQGYVEIVEDLLLGFRVPVFSRRAKRKVSVHPKFYFFDAGVFRSLRPTGPLDPSEGIEGQTLEGLVAQHLRAWLAYRGDSSRLHFWRTRSGVEVDFVVYGPKEFFAVEVKNAVRIGDEDLRGLRSLQSDYPTVTTLLLYRGKERLKRHNVLCLPCESFLAGLRPEAEFLHSV
jgi:predicted AAA+ superfamily ATPase